MLGAARLMAPRVSGAAQLRFGAGSMSIARMSALAFATVNPNALSGQANTVHNLVKGEWKSAKNTIPLVDPLHDGNIMLQVSNTSAAELADFVESLHQCPKSGLHNPWKNPERYVHLGAVSARAGAMLRDPQVLDFFTRLIQRVVPKSYVQAQGEVKITATFLENFSGDQVRFLARSFGVSGDHLGQESRGYRVPYGPVAIIAPFNFPMEIPMLQLMGALYMGNKPVLKVDSKVSVVMEQALRLLHAAGLPRTDVDFINCDGPVMGELLDWAQPRNTQFTGSSRTANLLATKLKGRLFVEDAGFDWKILGPDVGNIDFVSYVSDQDAYASSGQKCSAQSVLFVHENWANTDLLEQMRVKAEARNLEDLTVGPVLTWTTDQLLGQVKKLLAIPGAKLLWGGKELQNHKIPKVYGAIRPTAVFVPIEQFPAHRELVTTEVFAPFQVITTYKHDQLDKVIEECEEMHAHLTAAVVSNDPLFTNYVLGRTINGTTYAGRRARTTGAPQNHWFGPAGDPRAAGIGSPEAIKLVWSCHREVIHDVGPIPANWTAPQSS